MGHGPTGVTGERVPKRVAMARNYASVAAQSPNHNTEDKTALGQGKIKKIARICHIVQVRSRWSKFICIQTHKVNIFFSYHDIKLYVKW